MGKNGASIILLTIKIHFLKKDRYTLFFPNCFLNGFKIMIQILPVSKPLLLLPALPPPIRKSNQ